LYPIYITKSQRLKYTPPPRLQQESFHDESRVVRK
jgi:hypothetical protein